MTAPPDAETRALARGGGVSLLGSATSAVMGFVLTVVLARLLGDSGSGVVLQAIAVFTIVLSFARAGLDSGAVWMFPRLVSADPSRLRGTLLWMLAVTAAAGGVCALGVELAAGFLDPTVADAVRAAGWFLPAGALLLVALAATRGLGGVVPYSVVGSIALPAARPLFVWIAVALGASLAMVTLAWALPLPLALVAAIAVLRVQVLRHEQGVRGPWRVDKPVRRELLGYAWPRTISAGLEQSIIWLDVLIVGVIAGTAAAGVYGGASRFVAAGLIIDSALRIVVSTRFSALLHEGRVAEVQSLYRTAATWLVLFGAPIYLILGVFASVVLGLLGPGFEEGSTALAILCGGAILTFAAGNIHSVLLMSGRSGWGAFNKAVVLALNIVGNLLLVPVLGIAGAALVWSASMLVDALLAAIEVRVFLGIRAGWGATAYALLVPLASVGLPALAARLVLGETLLGLLVGTALGVILFLTWCALDRRRLNIHALVAFAQRKQN
ncbi:flippase [Glaciihabitans arcticus]|uniref:Flippase n=1 Tax=Glaciihabitans arcticus TaxID=2668039 RepID=A0A4Q9H004_9MICO|nr:polysaccharide biosynthesis C-terminal domain-containing protein [Glaciihabitans arcticus]TBN57990.1 flippase [Glaciihabitans arcticus]